MKRAADHRQDEAKNQVRADDLWRRHFRVVQKQHGPESAGSGGGKSRFHADGEREPRQPAGILSSETWILYARGERHAGRRGEQDSEQDDDDRISSLLSYESQHQRAEEETGDGPEEKQPQIARVKVLSQEIERRGDQAQDSSEDERRAHSFTSRQPHDQDERGHSEAASANTGQTNGDGDQETDTEGHASPRFERVWMAHSNFVPPQRPALGVFGSTGSAGHCGLCMLW